MNQGWGHIVDVEGCSFYKQKKLIELIAEKTSGKIAKIKNITNDTIVYGIEVTLESGKTFCMGQIPAQCCWIVVGKYNKGKATDFLAVVEISEILAKMCFYGGLFVNAYYKYEETILKKAGFTCVYNNDLGSLYYKNTDIKIEYYDEDDDWLDYEENNDY